MLQNNSDPASPPYRGGYPATPNATHGRERERLPNFLLTPIPTNGTSPGGSAVPHANGGSSNSIPAGVGTNQPPAGNNPAMPGAPSTVYSPSAASPAFNERLRPASYSAPPCNAPAMQTHPAKAEHTAGLHTRSPAAGVLGSSAPVARAPTAPYTLQPSPAVGRSGTPAGARKPPTRSLLDSGPGVISVYATPPPSVLRSGGALGGGTPYAATPTPSVGLTATPAALPATSPVRSPPTNSGSVAQQPLPGFERWITVYGFPAAMEALVVRELRRYGEVVRTHPGRGNWMHIMYRTPAQALVALHRPWRMLSGGGTMVGIAACTEPDVVQALVGAGEDVTTGSGDVGSAGVDVGKLAVSPDQGAGAVQRPGQLKQYVGAFGGGGEGHVPMSALRTPKSVLRRGVGSAVYGSGGAGNTPMDTGGGGAKGASPGPASILRTPQPSRGLLSYISDYMSGEIR